MSNYYNPVKVIKTDNWLFEINSSIERLKIRSPIIITSKGNRKRLELDSKFNSEIIYSDVNNNPTFNDSITAINFCQKNKFDSVIAIGGGSVMDLAKVVIAYLSLDNSDIHYLINYEKKYQKKIKSIFIPTTHGTASEVTMWGTIWDMNERKKYSISNIGLYPTIAILDANVTLSLPMDISIITTMDALSHSFESIWNKNSNPTSTNYAITSICSIIQNSSKLKKNPEDISIRKKLIEASMTAGLAFSNTKTAAAHSISYPITIHFGVPHGIASSITLVPLLEINKGHIKDSINKICNNLNITFSELVKLIIDIPNKLIPYTLKTLKIPKNKIQLIVNESFTKGRMDNNIVDLSKKDVENILQSIYQ